MLVVQTTKFAYKDIRKFRMDERAFFEPLVTSVFSNTNRTQIPDHFFFVRQTWPENLFSLELKKNSIENCYRRKSEELRPSPDLLNSTNLTWRPVCLSTILVFDFSKIQQHFHQAEKFLFPENLSQFRQLKSFLATAKNFLSQGIEINFGLAQLYPAKFLERILNMRLTIVNGGEKGRTLSQIYPENKNLSRNYLSQKKFICEVIQKENISLENFKSHPIFSTLSKNEKNLFRYHLKKLSPSFETVTPVLKRKKASQKRKGVVNFKVASLLMLPVLFSEFIILTFSYLFYIDLGFKLPIALMAAFSVELFFMATSGSTRKFLQVLRWVIFAYSAFTVCYSTYANDPKIKALDSSKSQSLKGLEYQLAQKKKTSKALLKQQAGIFADMEIYRKNELVSKGRQNVAKEKAEVREAIVKNNHEIVTLISGITQMKLSHANHSMFSKENLTLIELRSWCVMVFLALIQLLSSVCTNEFCHSLRDFQKKRKRKFKNRSSKGESYALQGAHITVQ